LVEATVVVTDAFRELPDLRAALPPVDDLADRRTPAHRITTDVEQADVRLLRTTLPRRSIRSLSR
jgi:hypothetical protein